jgi:hypothetical protein
MSSPQNPEQRSRASTEEVLREYPSSARQGLSRKGPVVLFWLSWTASCAVVSTAVMPLDPFVGLFILGGAFGLVQWLVLWAYFGHPNIRWVPFSFIGWLIGVLISSTVVLPLVGPGLTALAGRYESLAYVMVLGPFQYATLGFAQWLLLRIYLRRSGWWVLASAVGGGLGVTASGTASLGLEYAGIHVPLFFGGDAGGGVVGLIYGAITGAAMVWLTGYEDSGSGMGQPHQQDQQQEQRSTEDALQRLRTRRLLPIVVAVGSVVLIGGLLLWSLAGFFSTCSEEERSAFMEFPQYEGKQVEPESGPEGGCAAFFDTDDSAEQVRAYYSEQLAAHGWTLEEKSPHTNEQSDEELEGGEGEFGGPLVIAQMEGFTYEVWHEDREFYTPPQPGVHVAVHVRSEG